MRARLAGEMPQASSMRRFGTLSCTPGSGSMVGHLMFNAVPESLSSLGFHRLLRVPQSSASRTTWTGSSAAQIRTSCSTCPSQATRCELSQVAHVGVGMLLRCQRDNKCGRPASDTRVSCVQRLLAHRVAQYYGLETCTVEEGAHQGHILARRTPATKPPLVGHASPVRMQLQVALLLVNARVSRESWVWCMGLTLCGAYAGQASGRCDRQGGERGGAGRLTGDAKEVLGLWRPGGGEGQGAGGGRRQAAAAVRVPVSAPHWTADWHLAIAVPCLQHFWPSTCRACKLHIQ